MYIYVHVSRVATELFINDNQSINVYRSGESLQAVNQLLIDRLYGNDRLKGRFGDFNTQAGLTVSKRFLEK